MLKVEDQEVRRFKDPSKLKRSFSTFLIYAQDNILSIKEESNNKGEKFGALVKILVANFKALKEDELKGVSQSVLVKPLGFQEEIADFVFTEEPKRKKAKKDPNAPKRNMSAYFLYSIHARPQVKADNPEATFGELARLLSGKFKKLTEKEKKVWAKKAQDDKTRYEKEMEVYNKSNQV